LLQATKKLNLESGGTGTASFNSTGTKLSQFEVPKLLRTFPIFRPASLISSANFTYTCSEFPVNANFAKLRSPRPPSRPTYWVGPQRLAIFSKRATGFSELFGFLSIWDGASIGVAVVLVVSPRSRSGTSTIEIIRRARTSGRLWGREGRSGREYDGQ
jgi:hypothetical protein